MGLSTQQDPIGIAGGLNLYGYANGDPVNYSDPFGLCGHDDDEEEDECPVEFLGVGVNIVPGEGGGLSFGLMLDRSQGLGGIGLYVSGSVEAGLDVSTFVEFGRSSNRDDFEGADLEGCAGAGFVNACRSTSPDGSTVTGQIGIRNTLLPDTPVSATFGVAGSRGLTFMDVVNGAASLAGRLEDWIRWRVGAPGR